MTVFHRVWLGQLVSLMGSSMTSFAMGVWIYQETKSAALFSTLALFTILPNILFAPFAGVAADRWDRRTLMMGADAASAAVSLALAALLLLGRLEFWHVCILNFLGATLTLFHHTAYNASVAGLVEARDLPRANGLMQIATAGSQLLAPLLGGLLLGLVTITGIVVLDLVSFAVGVGSLAAVRFPPVAQDRPAGKRTVRGDLAEGWTYLRGRKDLLALVGFSAAINTLLSSAGVLAAPLVLSFASPAALGAVMICAGVGTAAGGLVLASWKRDRSPVVLAVASSILTALFAMLVGLRPSIVWVSIGLFGALACLGVMNGAVRAMLQWTVPDALLGRVMAAYGLTLRVAAPVGYMLSVPLADQVFQPMLGGPGRWSRLLAEIVGTGPGRGIALYVFLVGLACLVVGVVGGMHLVSRLGPLRLQEEANAAAPGPAAPRLSENAG